MLPGILQFRTAFAACAFALLALCQAGAQTGQVGWVVDTKGEWHLNGGQDRLKKFSSLPAEGRVSISAPADGDYIVIANLRGEIVRQIRCSKAACGTCVQNDSCTSPITPLPKMPEVDGIFTAAIEGIKELFGEHPERYSVHRSRSIARSCVAEAVLLLNADASARLDGLLRNCEEGTYTLEFRNASSTQSTASAGEPRQIKVSWNPASPNAPVPLDLPAGLFNVQYTRDWMSGSAWVLLTPSANYDATAASFKTFADKIDGWGEGVDPETKAAYKRANLDYLSKRNKN